MSVKVHLFCDHEGCPAQFASTWPERWTARKQAERDGWTHSLGGTSIGEFDYCPEHSPSAFPRTMRPRNSRRAAAAARAAEKEEQA